MKKAFVAILFLPLFGCATHNEQRVDQPSFRPGAHARGKHLAYEPIVTVHGLSFLNTALFEDLQRHFTGPLSSSEYRFVIDQIEIDATCEEFAQWTAEVKLDTGAKITLNQLNEFYDSDGASHFDAALQRAFSKLQTEQNRDPKLRQYIQEFGKSAALRPRNE